MSPKEENLKDKLSESELENVAGGGLLDAIGKNKKDGGREKPPYKTLPIDAK
ncbi:hypothetical protein PAECIP111893_04078 [Paenibacillus plantiphilus]|uniref:Bacteriocin-type signal sequence-containing protein n=1 Tax=Paenibacillus plantiphilus TaxID=2905650 RepID=A0ABM9CLY9_9BACL|nr:hypothetical protein [Paenibacillus plantiphilus]CAH1216225.1 hypothetical protein PAECIP111893_04078 [Paenibacillus plantiphilus]